MNQIIKQKRLNKPYKEKETKKLMENKLLIAILILSTITLNTAYSEDVCRYIEGQTIFRCDDALPNLIIIPGTEQNLTIYCCLTGDSYNNTNSYQGNIKILPNYTYRNEYFENGTMISEILIKFYNASKWISAYYLPEDITGFQTFPVIITFKAPTFSNEYKEGMILNARFDLSIHILGKMIPQLAIIPNIMLPADYKTVDYRIYIYIVGAVVLLLVLFIITFKNNRINHKVKGLFRKLKSKAKKQETKEEPKVEQKKEDEKKHE
ncbi:MAG: hypothetical protein PHN56_03180 [Candidatus Nanoarchaeia archaeon]|nr:hypothetical protein [Candidatus Nanoarchaeia archaeon]